VPAAFLQAVSQAMDHYFKTIPLKRKEIWEIAKIKKSDMQAQK
jgi:ribosomal protein L11